MIFSRGQRATTTFSESLTNREVRGYPYLFYELWALPHQKPPEGKWRTWVILGGRGAGKTRAGAEWVRSVVEGGRPEDAGECSRVALIGETFDQVRDVMVFGESGIVASSPPDRVPQWQATKRQLVWKNGAVAKCYSATDFEGLRGPQFDAAWLDEFAKWRRAQDAWDMLQFALRLGDAPRQVVTTTPRDVQVLRTVLGLPDTVRTQAPTKANRANLAEAFFDHVEARYEGTRLGRQELDGELIDAPHGALWTREMLEAACVDAPGRLDRIVVGVDPVVTGGRSSDACGIVVAGIRGTKGHPAAEAVVLADETVQASQVTTWAETVVAAYHLYSADRIVAEVNQGGDLVEEILRQIDASVPVRKVTASRGKVARAEPVAALYEKGRIKHVRGLGALEEEMRQMTYRGYRGKGSPDRVDALVWALTELMLGTPVPSPHVRSL